MNTLYYGDNLDILRRHIKDETIDLIYLDPPFKSSRNYNVIFEQAKGAGDDAQIRAFEDTWHWDYTALDNYKDIVERGGDVSLVMQAFKQFLGENDMMAYLAMMAPRLIELKRVLKQTGSIFLHCDPTASHYLKILMDAIFKKTFRNEIIWHYKKWPAKQKQFSRNHDVIFFYSKSDDKERVFNKKYMARAASTLKRFGDAKIISSFDETGKRKPSQTEESSSPGVPLDDVWDISRVPPIKQLFPTQKPDALLERIIEVCTDEGHVVLDPFCGCGTTVITAQKLKRNWIGIDITHLAITLIKHRLADSFAQKVGYKVIGEPVDLNGAMELAKSDKYQFQWWALGLVDARPIEQKKGADKGIDGRLFFHDDESGKTRQIIFSVKGGAVNVAHVRDLNGVLKREGAEMGVIISARKPTSAMRKEASAADVYRSEAFGKNYPKVQILTVEDLLNGKKIDMPYHVSKTFKKTEKVETTEEEQSSILD